jgi:hypothetical protein
MRSRASSLLLLPFALLPLALLAAPGCSSETRTFGGTGGAGASGTGGAGGAASTSTSAAGGAGGAAGGGAGGASASSSSAGGAGGGPAECMTNDDCPAGYGCACGGPGPGPWPCHCGLLCNADADCADPLQNVCCNGICTDPCTCYCD